MDDSQYDYKCDHDKVCPDKVCPAVVYRLVNVSVPVTVTPTARTGHPSVKCFGRPNVCVGIPFCCNDKPTSCSFVISQQVCVGIPVAIGATVCNDDPFVNCCGPGAGLGIGSESNGNPC
jgi:hypothetical protein